MRITVKDAEIELLGDPHLGRPFVNGVPLNRRGDRETLQWLDFERSLESTDEVDLHVCMGDLFDRVFVSNNVVDHVASLYKTYAKGNAVCLPGNHDISRDRGVVSSFELFAQIVQDSVIVPMFKPHVMTVKGAKLGFIPWHPTRRADDLVRAHADELRGCDAVFGHWDVVAFNDTSNLLPAEALAELDIPLAVTGHDHLRRELKMNGVRVIVTGSMQPYSHAEDPEGVLYLTVKASEAKAALAVDEGVYEGYCIRVVLDEPFDLAPNCLQFQTVRVEETEIEEMTTISADFDFNALWNTAFEGVDADIAQSLRDLFQQIGGEE